MTGVSLKSIGLDEFALTFVGGSTPELFINQGVLSQTVLLEQFEPFFRLFRGEDLNKLVDALNNANVAFALLGKQRTLTAAGNYAVNVYDFNILVNKTAGQATTLTLPAARDRVNGGFTFGPLIIKDLKQDAGANPITVLPATVDANGNSVTDTIDGLAQWQIAGNGGSLGLRVLADKTGWYVT